MKCKATTKTGKPCRANAIAGSDYCVTHSRIYGKKAEEKSAAKAVKSQDAGVKDKPKAATSPGYVQSSQTAKAPSWEKEEFRMDEKKNVGFVPGLALILAALALVLIAINQVKPTPTMEALEKSMDQKIVSVENAILAQVRSEELLNSRFNRSMLKRDLANLEYTLDNLSKDAGEGLAADIAELKAAIQKMKFKLEGVKPPAPEAKPAE